LIRGTVPYRRNVFEFGGQSLSVIPAQAGIQEWGGVPARLWIPAFAGMTFA